MSIIGKTYSGESWSAVADQVSQDLAVGATNAEVVAVVSAWHDVTAAELSRAAWPQWWEHLLVAAGWEPPDTVRLTADQASRAYPQEATEILREDLALAASIMDRERLADQKMTIVDIRNRPDILMALAKEAEALLRVAPAFRIPLPACKDPKSGKLGPPKKDPKTGKWACDVVTVEDPVSRVGSGIGKGLLVLALAYAVYKWNRS